MPDSELIEAARAFLDPETGGADLTRARHTLVTAVASTREGLLAHAEVLAELLEANEPTDSPAQQVVRRIREGIVAMSQEFIGKPPI